MNIPRVIGVRSIELGVRDLRRSVQFYSDVWGLSEVSVEAGLAHLRGTGLEHHVLTLREQSDTKLIAVHMAARDSAAVDGLAQRAQGFGATIEGLGELSQNAGAARISLHDAGWLADEHLVRRARSSRYGGRPLAADQDQPCRAQ